MKVDFNYEEILVLLIIDEPQIDDQYKISIDLTKYKKTALEDCKLSLILKGG